MTDILELYNIFIISPPKFIFLFDSKIIKLNLIFIDKLIMGT